MSIGSSNARVGRLRYAMSEGDPIFLWLADATAAARLVGVLPKRITKDFRPRLAK